MTGSTSVLEVRGNTLSPPGHPSLQTQSVAWMVDTLAREETRAQSTTLTAGDVPRREHGVIRFSVISGFMDRLWNHHEATDL